MNRSFHPVQGIIAILLGSMTLRIIFTGISPHQQAVQEDLGASYAQFGLLAALPQFCTGLFSFLLPLALRLASPEQVALVGLTLISTLLLAPFTGHSLGMLYLLVILGGAGIALTQPAMQAVIKHHYPRRTLQMVSLSILGMNCGAGLTAIASPALANSLGGWTWALGFLGLLIVPCAIFWAMSFSVDLHTPTAPPARKISNGKMYKSKLTWLIVAYFVSSGTVYISLLSWLPGFFQEQGDSHQHAANMLGIFVFSQAVAALGLTIISRDHWGRRKLLTLGFVLMITGILIAITQWRIGLIFFPVLTGLGLGVSFPVAMSLPHAYSTSPEETAQLTMYALGAGSMLCAPFPFFIGWLKDLNLLADPLIVIVLTSSLVMAGIIPLLSPDRRVIRDA
ncbi:MAG: MFS transporter [Thiotrichales bacterium]